jgi:GTPase-associated protein 1, N-terminal domain type 2/GTPase-associated protein 1, middle domain
MSGFGSLYYTDCLPGQGLNGSAGFQFQAATPGLATEAMPLVQRSALYEPPASWMRERRAVDDYPRSLVHISSGGICATAAGRYLGQEANGSRQGNQFTHAVVTRDADDYCLLRPAQLWGAMWWAGQPAPGTELAELPPGPAPGPLDIETVSERLRGTDGGETQLTALLSAVERLAHPDLRQPIVLVSADPEKAACWIAAATLLLPLPLALRVGFKIFVADPQYGQHDIIALHPEWAGSWADTGEGRGLAVFDLDRGQHTTLVPTEAARFWVPRFLTADAFDIVDAVELAGQLARERGRDAASEAERVVSVLVAAGEMLTGPDQLEQVSTWLLEAPSAAVEIVREQVLDAVLAAGPQPQVLRTLAAAAGARRWAAASIAIRAGLLTAEIDEALAAPDGVAATRKFSALDPLPPHVDSHTSDDARAAQIEVALSGARPHQVPALLTVASRHGVRPAPARFKDAADSFARWWVAHTGTAAVVGLELDTWQAAPETVDWVHRVLQDQIRSPHRAAAIAAIAAYWWEPLLRYAHDPADPLDAELFNAAYGHLDQASARELLGRVQDAARHSPHADVVAWQALFGSRAPGMTRACDFLEGLVGRKIPISSQVGTLLADVGDREPRSSEDALWMGEQLVSMRIPLPPRMAETHRHVEALSAAEQALRNQGPKRSPEELAATFGATPDELLEMRAPGLAQALLDGPGQLAVDVLRACPRSVMIRLAKAVEQQWPRDTDRASRHECRALALSFLLISTPVAADRLQDVDVFAERLAAVVKKASPATRQLVEASYEPGLGEPWRAWLSEIDAGRLKRLQAYLGSRFRSEGDPSERHKPRSEQPGGVPGGKHAKRGGSVTKGWHAGRGGD